MSEPLGRALIVEDEPAVQAVTVRIVQWIGFECTTASTFEQAMAALSDGEFQLVVTDVKLPDGSGLDIAEAAAALVPRPAVVVVSGFVTSDEEERTRTTGLSFLRKPYTAKGAKAAVEEALAAAKRFNG